MTLREIVPIALAADTVSIAIMEIVDNGVLLVIPGRDGGRPRGRALLVEPGARARRRLGDHVPGEPLDDRRAAAGTRSCTGTITTSG